MTPDSFQYSTGNGSWNSYDDWGIRIIARDVAAPEKRNNSLTVPKVGFIP